MGIPTKETKIQLKYLEVRFSSFLIALKPKIDLKILKETEQEIGSIFDQYFNESTNLLTLKKYAQHLITKNDILLQKKDHKNMFSYHIIRKGNIDIESVESFSLNELINYINDFFFELSKDQELMTFLLHQKNHHEIVEDVFLSFFQNFENEEEEYNFINYLIENTFGNDLKEAFHPQKIYMKLLIQSFKKGKNEIWIQDFLEAFNIAKYLNNKSYLSMY